MNKKDLEEKITDLIEQYSHNITEIERLFFSKTYSLRKEHIAILANQSIPILYSYWESFVQNSFNYYIQFINSQEIAIDEYSDEILVFYLENKFRQFLSYPNDFRKKIKFHRELLEMYSSNEKEIPFNVNTESNIGFEVLNKLLKQLSLEPFPDRWGKYNYPNNSLKDTLTTFLKYRNLIAHGNDISNPEKITQNTYSKFRIMIIDLMYELYLKIINGVDKKSFLKINDKI